MSTEAAPPYHALLIERLESIAVSADPYIAAAVTEAAGLLRSVLAGEQILSHELELLASIENRVRNMESFLVERLLHDVQQAVVKACAACDGLGWTGGVVLGTGETRRERCSACGRPSDAIRACGESILAGLRAKDGRASA